MLRDIVSSIKSHEIDDRRMKQALDMLLDYLLQFDGYGVNQSRGLFGYRQQERRYTGLLK